jgi:tetratricopeptide (TPR) repeat protein
MVEYMDERFGESALVRLLGLYFEGVREQEAMAQALGIPRDEFYEAFLEWAGAQLVEWGLVPPPPMPSLLELEDTLRWADPELSAAMAASQKARLDAISRSIADRIGRPVRSRTSRRALTADLWPDLIRPPVEIDDAVLDEWLEEYPGHPDLLELRLRSAISEHGGPDETHIDLLARYALARPADPFPHKKLVQIWTVSNTPGKAIHHLEELDKREQKSPVFAFELARLYRSMGDTATALSKATRAVQISPYDADYREQAAAIAIESGRLDLARTHILAMTLLEPGQSRHRKRLEAIDRLIEK